MPDDSAADWTKRNRTLMLRRFDEYRPKGSYRVEDGLPRLEPADGIHMIALE
jgi:hypothetical protein